MNPELAHALQERRQSVERIIQKLQALDRSEQAAADALETPRISANQLLSSVKTFSDLVNWVKLNFEPTDVLLLETKFKNKLNIHPERAGDPNYCRLLALVFYLMATNQCARVYGEFSHRAIGLAFSTHLDMYHSLHLLEIVCYLAEVAVQSYGYKARIAEVLDTLQDYPLTEQQELTLAKLCLMPEHGQALGPLYFANDCEDKARPATNGVQPGIDLFAILEAVNQPEKGQSSLTQRHNLLLDEDIGLTGQRVKRGVPYCAPNLELSLRLHSVLTINVIKKSTAALLLDKLTNLWEILLPLHIDLGAMKDFQ